jgi:vancomycin resistance protein YoaR
MPDGTFTYSGSQNGRALDAAAAASALRQAAADGLAEVALPVRETTPEITDALRRDARDYAQAVLAAPLTLPDGDRRWTIDKPELADWLQFEAAPGGPMAARLEADAVRKRVAAIAKEIDRPATSARFDWNGGSPRVIRASAQGRQLDVDAAADAIVAAAPGAERTVALPVRTSTPAADDTIAASLASGELIQESSTTFAGSLPEKAHNIRLAAERLHGTVVPPGATFSFNREVGPTTIDTGYQWGFAIEDSGSGARTIPSVAGGICQVATTLFQAFFWSGYRLEERHWHLYWIPNYTSKGVVGLDATVDEDSDLDLQFVNTTANPVLIQSAVTNDTVTFRLYGVKPSWTVDVAPAEITNRVPADTTPVVEQDPTLPAGRRIVVESAREGFDATIVRKVTENGDTRELRLKSNYRPSRNVTLVGTGGAGASSAASAQNRPTGDRTRE